MNNIALAASDELRVVFDYRVDRWGHTIEVRREGEWVAAFSSIEGTATDDWPPSPPFQHVHLQSVALNGPTALLVGKSGTSHWSAAVEADREAGILRFDIACRLGGEPTVLGSKYARADALMESMPFLPQLAVATINDACQRTLEVADNQFMIRIGGDLLRSRTVRWKYVVSRIT